jgi:hypothetical protein
MAEMGWKKYKGNIMSGVQCQSHCRPLSTRKEIWGSLAVYCENFLRFWLGNMCT